MDRIDRFVRGSTSRSCFPLLSLSLFPVRTLFGRSLIIRCNFAPVVLGILGQPRLLDFCGSSGPLCQRFNFSFLFLFSGGDRKWSLASIPVLVSGGDPVTTKHRRTWPPAPAPVLVSDGDRKWSPAHAPVLFSDGDRTWSLAHVRVLFSGGDRTWSLDHVCVLFTGGDHTWSLTLVDLFSFVSSGRLGKTA